MFAQKYIRVLLIIYFAYLLLSISTQSSQLTSYFPASQYPNTALICLKLLQRYNTYISICQLFKKSLFPQEILLDILFPNFALHVLYYMYICAL